MEYFSKRNLFIYCWIAACLSLLTYLVAFSCEVSWILEARGDLPVPSYFLCSIFFVLFVASTILIHGLTTGLSWGLFSWSIVIGSLAIPELFLVMYMTTQFWGLESNHGIIELVSYLVRLVFNCLALMCVIPTALSWRHEKKILAQLESLAARLQLTSPSANLGPFNNSINPQTKCIESDESNNSLRGSKKVRNLSRRPSNCVSNGVDNPGFMGQENGVNVNQFPYKHPFGSQNEFDASIFGMSPSQYIGPPIPNNIAKKTQSLVDLRYFINTTTTTTKIVSTSNDDPDSISLTENTVKTNIKNKINSSKNLNNRKKHSDNEDARTTTTEASEDEKMSMKNDPIYNRIESPISKKSLSRNCVSLENLGALTTTFKNDLGPGYGQNFVPVIFTYHQPHPQQQHMYYPYYMPQQYYGGQYYPNTNIPMPYFHPYAQPPTPVDYNYNYHPNSAYFNHQPVFANSRQSLGNVSDDFRKYRDVAL